MSTVYTVGHSTRSLEELIKLLKAYGVGILVDVRRFPTSSICPHFKAENLEKALKRRGIRYVWLGDKLGGFRKGGYAKYMETEDFRRGLEELVEVIEEGEARGVGVAIMCSEKLWFKCHRRFIADALAEKGIKVLHIIDEGRLSEHKRKRRR
ncbi:MAG: DUF488 domain-containing protein [Thermoprotei archaeon]|nr:MAG: DUF488 domain-containing protein [Thermoprotei archaeon]HDD33784.1 DUF488 family protein [Thermofilaceae archaeon]